MAQSDVTRRSCKCTAQHPHSRIVLTGGPGAGKTAVLELVKRSYCEHLLVLPESAGIVFGGGFPRRNDQRTMQSAQRAIFFVQRELENAEESGNPAVVLCDRGTVDGGAYWPGEGNLWEAVGTTVEEQFARYAAVIHLRVPSGAGGYNNSNPLRTESAEEAARIDERIARIWSRHPQRFEVLPSASFIEKAGHVLDIINGLIPECCRHTTVSANALSGMSA